MNREIHILYSLIYTPETWFFFMLHDVLFSSVKHCKERCWRHQHRNRKLKACTWRRTSGSASPPSYSRSVLGKHPPRTLHSYRSCLYRKCLKQTREISKAPLAGCTEIIITENKSQKPTVLNYKKWWDLYFTLFPSSVCIFILFFYIYFYHLSLFNNFFEFKL